MVLLLEGMGTVQVYGDHSVRLVPETAAEVAKDTSGGDILRQHSGKQEGRSEMRVEGG